MFSGITVSLLNVFIARWKEYLMVGSGGEERAVEEPPWSPSSHLLWAPELKLQYFGHLMRRTDHWKRPWCWERLKAGGEGDNREWDGCMASQIWRTWVWVSCRSWWRTRNPGMLQSMGSQTWTQLNHWTELILLGAQIVTNLTAMLETQVPSLHQEDPLEKDKVTYSSILA